MSVSEFPLPSVSGSNPSPLMFTAIPETFFGDKTIYDDGGVDVALQHGGNGELRWIVAYDGLTSEQAAILDSHFNSAKWIESQSLSAFSFNFRDRDTAVLYSGVRYAKYEVSHIKTYIQSRNIELVKYP